MITPGEEEQIEALKRWWKNYGKVTIFAVILAIAASFGWRYWNSYKERHAEQASAVYVEMIAFYNQDKTKEFNQFANYLVKDYGSTPYAKYASLMLAKLAVENKNLNAAAKQLKWVVNEADSDAIRQVARIRLARVLLAQKQPKQALQMLATVDAKTYLPAINEVKGDAYLVLGQKDNARKAYAAALKQMKPTDKERTLLQMKYAQLVKNYSNMADVQLTMKK